MGIYTNINKAMHEFVSKPDFKSKSTMNKAYIVYSHTGVGKELDFVLYFYLGYFWRFIYVPSKSKSNAPNIPNIHVARIVIGSNIDYYDEDSKFFMEEFNYTSIVAPSNMTSYSDYSKFLQFFSDAKNVRAFLSYAFGASPSVATTNNIGRYIDYKMYGRSDFIPRWSTLSELNRLSIEI